MRPFTVLVLGGYGVFGALACRLLARGSGFRIVVAGRSAERAARFVRELHREAPDAEVSFLVLDVREALAPALKATGADLVIDAAGPFQGRDYRVARSCIEAGVHYVDLSDGRDFVCGIAALDGEARAKGVAVVSGASSVPGLSGAVAAHLSRRFGAVEAIDLGITPGNKAPRLMAAVLGYVGRRFSIWRGGRRVPVYGFQDLMRRTLMVSGRAPLGPRWFSLCDVPDLVLLPARFAGVGQVTFRAGLELAPLHLGLWLLSWPVRLGLIGSLVPFARLLARAARLLDWAGEDRGGMFVELTGRDPAGRRIRAVWTLVAEQGHGPYVPAVPAVILARALADGRLTWRGAGPCLDLFDLEDFALATRHLSIAWSEEVLSLD